MVGIRPVSLVISLFFSFAYRLRREGRIGVKFGDIDSVGAGGPLDLVRSRMSPISMEACFVHLDFAMGLTVLAMRPGTRPASRFLVLPI